MGSLAEAQKAAEAAGLINEKGDYFKLKEGDNRFRLASKCLAHKGTYKGEPNFKWLCYVIDRRDGKLKVFFMAHTVYKQIAALQDNPEYAFNELPMPYDVTVHADGAGTKEVKYAVIPARKETDLTVAEYDAIAEAKPIDDVQAALYEKQEKEAKGTPPAVGSQPDDSDPPF